jgi:hypothetical protein
MLVRYEYWWLLMLASILISQLLIVWYWPDAKAGTVANVLFLAVAAIGYGQWQMQQQGSKSVNNYVLKQPLEKLAPVQESDIAHLPPPVQQWLRHSGVIGRPPVQTVRLRQKGALRTSPKGKWMQADAVQYFNASDPAFVWQVDARMNAAMWFWGKDQYAQGRGNMLIKAYALVPLVNASGEKIDEGSMLRFLGELCWFPSAALSPYIHWQGIDAAHARATMRYRQMEASIDFEFQDGRLVSATAMRYMGNEKDAARQPWYIPCREWKNLGGYIIPTRGDVIWKLSSGDFNYYQWEITEIEYDVVE